MYQIDPLSPLQSGLPTMYDLPSEDHNEPGLPDEVHAFQPQLLRETFQSSLYPPDEVFIGTDINLYYDVRHTQWHKRPDWFAVLGVPRAVQQADLRWSYVVWQEGVNPFVVVELLSPGTESEDLGQTLREINQPPTKWEVYERILRIPYYIIFDRYTNRLRAFHLVATHYTELNLPNQKLWLEDVQLGLGVWEGTYADAHGSWLRCYDASGDWIPTLAEAANQEHQRADQAQQQAAHAQQRADQAQQQAAHAQQRADQAQQQAAHAQQQAAQEQERANQEQQRANQAQQQSERLAAQLRALGVKPDAI
jgi:Uma2 family endonuclease